MRLARFNIQTAAATDKRYFVGMPSPAAAGVIASTIYLFPDGPRDQQFAFAALAMVVVPALLMVSTIRFRSVKAIDVGWRRSYFVLFLLAVMLALIASHLTRPRDAGLQLHRRRARHGVYAGSTTLKDA